MSWLKSLLVVGVVLALIGGTSFASLEYSLDDGVGTDLISWGNAETLSMNIFNTDPSNNVIDQLEVAWGNLPAGTAAEVIIYSIPDNVNIPNWATPSGVFNLLQVVNTTVTADQVNTPVFDPGQPSWAGKVANPVWTTYNIAPTAITTYRFAVATIAVDVDNTTIGTTLLDHATNVPGIVGMAGNGSPQSISYIGCASGLSPYLYNINGAFNSLIGFSSYGYGNNPYLIRAADSAGASAGMPFTWVWGSNHDTGASFNWNNSGGQNNWNTGVGGVFPNHIDDTANISTYGATIDLGGNTYTIGTMNLTSGMWWATLANLQNGTLNFQVSSGSALIHEQKDPWATSPDLISANIQMSSPLTVATLEFGQWGMGWATNNGMEIDGLISGNNDLTKTGPGTLYLTNASNSFTGNVRVQDGRLRIDNWAALGNSANSIILGGDGTIGSLYMNDSSALSRSIVLSGEGGEILPIAWTGPGWTGFAGPASELNTVISGTGNLFIGMGYATSFGGASDNTYVGDTKVLGWANVLTSARALKGNVSIEAGGRADLLSSNNLDSGASVYVGSVKMPCPTTNIMGILSLAGDFVPTIDPTSSGFLSLASNMPGGNYETGTTGPNINAALAANPAALAAGTPTIGNGYMYIGCSQAPGIAMAETFTGASLQPDLDRVFRFMVGNANLNLDDGGAGVLTDVGGVETSVEINATPYNWGVCEVYSANTQTFTGALTINPASSFEAYAQNVGGGSSFGSNAALGAVNLNNGMIFLRSGTATPEPITKGDLNIQGMGAIQFREYSSQGATMSFTNINRNDHGVLTMEEIWGGMLGNQAKMLVTTPGAITNTNGMAPAYFLKYSNSGAINTGDVDAVAGFLKYDATSGFMDAAFTATDSFGSNNGTDIVKLTGNTVVAAGTNVWALQAGGSLTGGDITIGSGGLILTGAPGSAPGTWGGPTTNLVSTTNINFGSAKGIIYSCGRDPNKNNYWYTGWNELAGTITGSGGLTFASPFNGNGCPYIFITGDNSATLTGQITIDMGIVEINSAKALGASTNTIYLNGGTGNNGNCVFGALAVNNGSTIALNNPIVLGPNGGTLLQEWGTFNVYGQISGTGSLTVAINSANLYNATNNWTGGTVVTGATLTVEAGAKIGPGPVVITGGGALSLTDTMNTDNTNDITIYNSWGFTDNGLLNVYGLTSTIGTLSGSGRVMLDAGQWERNGASTTLNLGNSESSNFYGIIQDCDPSDIGNIVKQGAGTFTLWGEGTYRGSTTVNNGTFAVNGKIAGGGVTVNSGGTLTGTGCIGTNVSVNDGGTLTGSLHITGGLGVYGGTVNVTGATVDGGLYMDAGIIGVGSYGGSSTVNGDSETDGGTITGSHTFNGSLTLDSYDGAASITGTNTINGSLNVGYYGDACSVSGATTINSPTGNVGLYLGSISGTNNYTVNSVWVNPWGYGPCTFSGAGTINAGWFVEYANSTVSGTYTFNSNVQINGGTFNGNHTIHGSFTTMAGSNAVVAPHNGATAGTLTVVGNVALDQTTTLNFNLGQVGTVGGGINDLIAITGDLSLDGTLNVTALTNFGPGVYTLFTYTGALTQPNGDLAFGTMPAGGYTYSFTSGTLHSGSVTTYEINLTVVMPYAPGDTNRDGQVNSLDIDAIFKHFGADATSQWKVATDGLAVGQQDVTYELHTYFHTNYADANLDTKTDFVDFQVLLDHWQASGPSIGWAQGDFDGSGSVDFLDFQKLLDYWNPSGWSFAPAQTPEPATLSLLALGGLTLLRRGKK